MKNYIEPLGQLLNLAETEDPKDFWKGPIFNDPKWRRKNTEPEPNPANVYRLRPGDVNDIIRAIRVLIRYKTTNR